MRQPRASLDTTKDGNKAFAVYWSIYTDWRGRRDFRRLYWDRLKDAIGRPAKLIGMEREELWPSLLPSQELRCHVWQFLRAASDAGATIETLRAAMRVAPEWRVITAPRLIGDRDTIIALIWDRKDASAELPFPKLTSIMVEIHRDTGFQIRPGYTVQSGSRRKQTAVHLCPPPGNATGSLTVTWRAEVQTSTKRTLMQTHWPLLQCRFGGDAAEMVDLDKRSGDIGPFRFKIRQPASAVTKIDAIMIVLSEAGSLTVALQDLPDGRMTLRGNGGVTTSERAHRITGFEATWTPASAASASQPLTNL